MRKAAGILMTIFSMTTVGIYFELAKYYVAPPNYLAVTLLTIFAVVPIITGGVFCLKRRYWRLCFALSLWLLLFMILFLLSLPSIEIRFRYIWVPCFLIPMGILPQIFICLRRSEWSESQA